MLLLAAQVQPENSNCGVVRDSVCNYKISLSVCLPGCLSICLSVAYVAMYVCMYV